MATIADELLNDFEDSGSEAGEDGEGEVAAQNASKSNNVDTVGDNHGNEAHHTSVMDLDDENDDGSEDDMQDLRENSELDQKKPGADAENEEEAKARVEKMKFGAVNDVRTVAGLMKTLGPVLEVSFKNSSLQSKTLCSTWQ